MTRLQKALAVILSSVSLLATKGEAVHPKEPPAQTQLVIRIDGFNAYRLPLF